MIFLWFVENMLHVKPDRIESPEISQLIKINHFVEFSTFSLRYSE